MTIEVRGEADREIHPLNHMWHAPLQGKLLHHQELMMNVTKHAFNLEMNGHTQNILHQETCCLLTF